jgi:hypothetical protein
MRFLNTPHTIAEHRHQQMPVYESYAAVASAAISIGSSVASSYLSKKGGGGGGGGGMSSYPSFGSLSKQALKYAPKYTQANIDLQNQVTPGSSGQREQALQQLNSYISGQIPIDVQENIQRQIAQNLGGGFNLYNGGGQAPNAFARNLGMTSVGLSQYGLSAAPTWQHLANTMVTTPASLLSSIMGTAENQYQAQSNQFGAQQAQGQQNASMLNGALGSVAGIFGSQGAQGGFGGGSGMSGFAGLMGGGGGGGGGGLGSFMGGGSGGGIPAATGGGGSYYTNDGVFHTY